MKERRMLRLHCGPHRDLNMMKRVNNRLPSDSRSMTRLPWDSRLCTRFAALARWRMVQRILDVTLLARHE
eukprot:759979-Pleurochrysis_carterae.AAC.1